MWTVVLPFSVYTDNLFILVVVVKFISSFSRYWAVWRANLRTVFKGRCSIRTFKYDWRFYKGVRFISCLFFLHTCWHWCCKICRSISEIYRLIICMLGPIFSSKSRGRRSIWVVHFDISQECLSITHKLDSVDRDFVVPFSENLFSWPLEIPLIRAP